MLLVYFSLKLSFKIQTYAEGLVHLDSARTLQGSPLSFTCGGTDSIVSMMKTENKRRRADSRILTNAWFCIKQGEIFVKDGNCRIVQRHLVFKGGIAYGIDCLLTPPSLGGRCDEQTTFDLKVLFTFSL